MRRVSRSVVYTMQWMGLICCGMAVQRMGMVGVNVRIMKAHTDEVESDTDW
jgi:hypothetical protein